MRVSQEREQEEKTRRETEAQRDAMTKFATGKRQFFKARLSEVVGEENALRVDLKTLTTVVTDAMSEKDAQGNERKYESKVLRILKNPEVNSLAAKHLASDFSGVVATFIERVREARAADAKYDAAVERVEAMYVAATDEAKKWSAMSKQQRDGEISRLQGEIKSLEASRKDVLAGEGKNITRHSIIGGTRQNQERLESERTTRHKIGDLDRQIGVKRRQIDFLRNPDVMSRQSAQALASTQHSQDMAASNRRRALVDVDKHFKPKQSLVEVVAEFDADTIGRLRKTLSDKIATLEKEEKALKDKVAMADEILLAIPLCDIGELKRQRLRLEK